MNTKYRRLYISIMIVCFIFSFPVQAEVKYDWFLEAYKVGRGYTWRNTNDELQSLGSLNLSLDTTIGSLKEPYYIYLPIKFRTVPYRTGMSQILGTTADLHYIVMLQNGPHFVSLTSRGISSNPYSFRSINDPLGALKLPNSSSPVMTFKLRSEFGKWDIESYFLADRRVNFIPRTELIPDSVYTELKIDEKKMTYYDEIPSYKMLRTSRKAGNWNFGLLWGQKEAVNIAPREYDDERTISYPNHRVGYVKTNVGADLVGNLQILGKPIVTMAFVNSEGDWRKYNVSPGELGNDVAWNSLGKVGGSAIKLGLSKIKVGDIQIENSFHRVELGFQWVGARNSRYYHFYDHESLYGYFGWRALIDENFYWRNPDKMDEYISDVSTYLGLSVFQTKITVPGSIGIRKGAQVKQMLSPLEIAKHILTKEEIRSYQKLISSETSDSSGIPLLFSVNYSRLKNLNEGVPYFEPYTWRKLQKGYRDVRVDLDVDYSIMNKLNFYLGQRDYGSVQDYQRDLGFGISSRLAPTVTAEGKLGLTKRSREDNGPMEGSLLHSEIALKGHTGNGVRFEIALDSRNGEYEKGLLKETADLLLAEPYSYLGLRQYLEIKPKLEVGSVPLNTIIACEVKREKSSLAELDGVNFIGYFQTNMPFWGLSDLTFSGTLIKGIIEEDDWSNYTINSLVRSVQKEGNHTAYSVRLRPFGTRVNYLELKYLTNYDEEVPTNSWQVMWRSYIGKHQFYLSYNSKTNTLLSRFKVAF